MENIILKQLKKVITKHQTRYELKKKKYKCKSKETQKIKQSESK